MKTIIIVITACLLATIRPYARAVITPQTPATYAEALDELDRVIQQKPYIHETKIRRIDSLKVVAEKAPHGPTKVDALSRLIDEYRHFDVDSTLRYTAMAAAMADSAAMPDKAERLRLAALQEMPLKLLVHEAINIIDTVNPDRLPHDTRRTFLMAARRAYVLLTSLHSPKTLNPEYFNNVARISAQLLADSNGADPLRDLWQGCVYLGEGKYSLAAATLAALAEETEISNPHYSDIASMLCICYFMRGDIEQWKYCTALAAISEIANGYTDGENLRQLSAAIIHDGEISRAHTYLLESQNDIAYSGAWMRGAHTTKAIPLISKAHRRQEIRTTWFLSIAVVTLTIIAILVAYLVLKITAERKQLEKMRTRLQQANETKETYLSELLTLCTTYMEHMEDFNKIVSRKLSAGKTDELLSMSKSGKFTDDQRRMFYSVFDDTLLHIYPSFIDEVNALFEPDRRIAVADGQKLTPELRIIAFMRLGSDDSGLMARLLGLSLNTIYTYRNRAKSRAINRDTFESDIMKIGRIA